MAAANADGDAPPLHFFDFGSDDEGEATSATRPLPELRLADPAQPLAASPAVLFVSFGAVPTECLRVRLQLDSAAAMADVSTARSEDGVAHATTSPICQKGEGEGAGVATVCVGAAGITGSDAPSWATQLLGAVATPKFVAILTEEPLFKYRRGSAHDQGEVVLRSLATTAAPALAPEAATPTLDQPNIVSGAAAALLSKCQIRGIPARLFVSYRAHGGTDKDVDMASMASFDPAFADPAVSALGAAVVGDADAHQAYQGFVRSAWNKPSSSLMYL